MSINKQNNTIINKKSIEKFSILYYFNLSTVSITIIVTAMIASKSFK